MGQAGGADQSNEIVAIPKLLDLLSIEGATVAIDAMGCQRESAARILDKEADDMPALKGNQTSLHQDVALYFTKQTARGFAECAPKRHETLAKSHGRIELRTITAIDDIAWLQEHHHWPGLQSSSWSRGPVRGVRAPSPESNARRATTSPPSRGKPCTSG